MSDKSTNVDQIRDLIFGDQMASYDENMAKMQSQIDDLRGEIKQFFSGIEKSLSALQEERSKALTALQEALKETENRFNDRLQSTESNLREMISDTQDASADRQGLADALIALGNSLKTPGQEST